MAGNLKKETSDAEKAPNEVNFNLVTSHVLSGT